MRGLFLYWSISTVVEKDTVRKEINHGNNWTRRCFAICISRILLGNRRDGRLLQRLVDVVRTYDRLFDTSGKYEGASLFSFL